MAKKRNIIEIDLDEWTTIAQKAKADGILLTTLSSKIMRKKIEVWHIPELKITLVKKKDK